MLKNPGDHHGRHPVSLGHDILPRGEAVPRKDQKNWDHLSVWGMENNETCFKRVETASCCAPKSSKTFTTSKCPRRAARCKAVAPCAFDTSFAAPASNKSLTTARWPSCEAKCRGVVPLSVTLEVLQRGTNMRLCVHMQTIFPFKIPQMLDFPSRKQK